jgi:hypothetical protein
VYFRYGERFDYIVFMLNEPETCLLTIMITAESTHLSRLQMGVGVALSKIGVEKAGMGISEVHHGVRFSDMHTMRTCSSILTI